MTSGIPKAIPSMVPQGVFYLWNHLWKKIPIIHSILEGAFYGSVGGVDLKANRHLQQISKTLVDRIHGVQTIFNVINVGTIWLCATKLCAEIPENTKPHMFKKADDILSTSLLAIAILFAVAVDKVILNQVSRYFFPTTKKVAPRSGVVWEKTSNLNQKISKVLHLTKLILNITSIYFAKNRFWIGMDLAASGYSLWKNTRLEWMYFRKNFQEFLFGHMNKVEVVYKMLLLSPKGSSVKEKCSICLDDTNELDMTFCTYHAFHQNCIIPHVIEKINDSGVFLKNSFLHLQVTDHYRDHVYTHTSHAYSAKIPQDNLPSCPICRDFPPQNGCDIKISDTEASVTLAGKPSAYSQELFEKLYTTYNVVQTGLSYLQKYPELAVLIFKIQKILLVINFLGYALTLYFLAIKLIEIGASAKDKENFDKAIKNLLITTIGILATASLSYLIVFKINPYLQSSSVLEKLFKQLPISSEILEGLEMKWESPLIHRLMQCVHINQIVASIALAFFSKQKMLQCVNIVAQIFTLFRISQLKWIKCIQRLHEPDMKMRGSLNRYMHQYSLKTLNFEIYFMVHPSCTTEETHLQSVVKSIYRYINNMFDKSDWDRYWKVTYKNGVEISKVLHYKIKLQPNPISSCECTLTPTVSDLSMNFIDSQFGKAVVGIKYPQ